MRVLFIPDFLVPPVLVDAEKNSVDGLYFFRA